LQEGEFVSERAFEDGLADLDRAALPLAVVVGVVPVPALRPAACEGAAARLAADEAAQREVWVIPLASTGYHDAAVEHGLRTVERGLVNVRLEVASRGL
jgi:hypothetical protein